MPFNSDFAWGIASAAYQIEGAFADDGKGLSVWDTFCRIPGKIYEGHTGDVACDHYHLFEQDVALWQQAIGASAYRFSVSWPRVLPEGIGRVNDKGIDFYDRLIDALLAHGMEPWVTLFHWDFPYELYCRGGWLNRDSADWFAEYAALMSERFSDRVRNWLTLNEPTAFVEVGHAVGNHAPGLQLGRRDLSRVLHNVLLAHGKAVQAIRAHAHSPVKVGLAHVDYPYLPASDSPEDIEAARMATFSATRALFSNNDAYSEPIYTGHYGEDFLRKVGADAPEIQSGDMETISQPLDFCGLNFYQGFRVRMSDEGKPEILHKPIQQNRTAAPRFGAPWLVTPEVMYWGSKFFHERYGKRIYIFENGMANRDYISQDGQVHDPQRIEFLSLYLQHLKRAACEDVDIGGYFHWGVMDDFEWPNGFSQRFGLIHVNFQSQRRTPKDSAAWYKSVIQTNGENLAEDQ